jgi:hypothetical protein
MSTAFAVGASNTLEKNAIVQDEAALHIAVSRQFAASVSTQIAALRRILFEVHVFNNTDYSQDALDRVRKVIHFAEKSKLHTTCSNIVGRYPARYPCRGRRYNGFSSTS